LRIVVDDGDAAALSASSSKKLRMLVSLSAPSAPKRVGPSSSM